MKTSVNWLQDYVDIPWTPAELARRLTQAGLEVEGIETRGAIPPGVVTAQILTRERHPNADKLSVCSVTTGGDTPLQIVCGAPNCDPGRIVPLATEGTDFGGGFKIKRAKLRGVESQGMMCSAHELGLTAEHEGLLLLPETTPLGRPLAEIIPGDTVIDWEVTPNRPDWLSHIGIAREVAAATGGTLRLPEAPLKLAESATIAALAAVEVQDAALCPRYTARVIQNVKVGPSPEWLVRRLESIGLRSINNVVDITNYVMLEYGQPLHAFDLATLAGQRLVVRRAKAGETLTTLDGRTHTLTPENLLIADAERGVALAGIMGGEHSGISEKTTTVLLESAAFNPANIRATARTLAIASDSSHRFERGVSWETVEAASRRAAALLCQIAGGEAAHGVLDFYPAPWQAAEIACRVQKVNSLLGIHLGVTDIAHCFRRRGLEVAEENAATVTVRIPHFRLDLKAEHDLVEEVAQIHGLDNIPEAKPAALLGGTIAEDTWYPVEAARAQLLALGLDEILNYTLISKPQALAGTGVAEAELVRVANPISSEAEILRPSLLPTLLQAVAHNIAHNNPELALVEIGRIFLKRPGVPEERLQAAIALTGHRHPERYGAERAELLDFFDLKGLLESWFETRRLAGATAAPATHPAFAPGAAAAFTVNGREVAIFGEAAPALTKGLRLKAPLFVALIELDALLALAPAPAKYRPLPQFPATARDISLVAPATASAAAIQEAIAAARCPWLEKVELFDLFTDETLLGPGNRSLAFSLTYRHPERTLTDAEANQAHEDVKAKLAKALPVQYR
ncbi:MAG: phenylalanine--tRNA ligase subunit beta [Lentisphaeria bacterium]|jgi:phenylalanyl-tRNA synthetase beta chain